MKRTFRTFTHRDATYRVLADRFAEARQAVLELRTDLEAFIRTYPSFAASFDPVELPSSAPAAACRMAEAAQRAGVGPMAAVAGTFAECAARAAAEAGAPEAIVDNGGDLFLILQRPALIGLYAGATSLTNELAFAVEPQDTPLAICSSSSRMGHSDSLGDCDLATVTAGSGALADAAATQAANLVRDAADIDAALQRIGGIPGVLGVLIVKDGRIGMVGCLPRLTRGAKHADRKTV